jgi:hypothetical protein
VEYVPLGEKKQKELQTRFELAVILTFVPGNEGMCFIEKEQTGTPAEWRAPSYKRKKPLKFVRSPSE